MRALIIVDVQNDFTTGSLATARGPEVAGTIANYIGDDLAEMNHYSHIIATQDWHIDPGAHFSETPDFVDSWPRHCVADTEGSQMHPSLADAPIEAYFRKGEYEAAYSGFEGKADGVALADWLRERGVTEFDVTGIATDHCVRATVLDGLKAGFSVRVLTGMCAAVDNDRGDAAFAEMEAAGAELV